jgi:hypothetical protein
MRDQYVDGPAEELLPFASLTITTGTRRYSGPGGPGLVRGLWAAGKPVQRPWIGLLGAAGELPGLAAHQQHHHDDRGDRGAAKEWM